MLEVKPISNPRSLLKWYEQRAKINLEPSYQRRGNLWPPKMKKLFINTILNKYDFPKIYFADFSYVNTSLNEAKTLFAVIDGKQRLTTIFDFFDNGFTLDSTKVFYEDHEYNLNGLNYDSLRDKYPRLCDILEECIPDIMSVISDRLQDVQEMFIRLNHNISVSGAEKRNAMQGPIPSLIKDLSVHKFIRIKCSFPISRGQDLNLAAKLLLLGSSSTKSIPSLKKSDLDTLVTKHAKTPQDIVDAFVTSTITILDIMYDMIFQNADILLKKPSQVPVYFLFTKSVSNTRLSVARDFLVDFELKRQNARNQESSALIFEDNNKRQDFVQYNIYLRSPDDSGNIRKMSDMLIEHFKNFQPS